MGHIAIRDGKIISKTSLLISELDGGYLNHATKVEKLLLVDLTPAQDACDIQALSWDGSKVAINTAKDTEIKQATKEAEAVKKSCTVEEFMQAYLLERAGDGSKMTAIAAKVNDALATH